MSGTDLIVRPVTALAERLAQTPTQQFYDWERRGRGWQLWGHPTYLEPPFRPFFRWHYQPPVSVDDGRRHTFLSRLIELASYWLQGRKPPGEQEVEVIDPDLLPFLLEPEIPPYEDEDGLTELQVILPPEAKVAYDTFTAFLVSLAYCSAPLSFEVIGTANGITVQLVCRESDVEQVREQLLAHFPEARLITATVFLYELWIERYNPAVIVDFGLSNEFMLPLKTLPTAVDPLVAVTGALGKLRDGEIGVFQVLFESVRHPWAESIFRAVTDDSGGAFFDNAKEMVGQAKQKIRSPLFAAVVRVAAKSPDEDRAWQIAKNLAGGLSHMTNPMVNELIPLENEGYDPADHAIDLCLRLTHRSGMLLNTEELVSLVHLPTSAVRSSKLRRNIRKTKAAPETAFGHELALGVNQHEDEERTVTLGANERMRHMHVIGASGSGKSTFLLNLILQDFDQGRGLAVLDPHGDLIDQIMDRLPVKRRRDVILIDPADAQFPIGFNILSAHSETEKQLLSSDLVGIFKRLSTAWGDQMNSVLGNAILAILESERGGTLADLRRFLVEKSFRDEFLKSVRDPECVYYWKHEFPMLTGGKSLGPLLTRLDIFLRPKLVRHMVAQKENKLNFAKIMDEGKIVLAKLAQGAIGEENAFLLGSLMVSKFHQIALARQEQRAADRRPFYLYIDEFHNFITPSMAQILTGARKYRLGLILAHQEMRQLKNDEVASAVIANPYTRVCFRLGDDDARKLENGFAFFEARDLQNLGPGEAICRLERAEYDFNIATPPLSEIDQRLGETQPKQTIIDLIREQYATPLSDVEVQLAEARAQTVEEEAKSERRRGKAAVEAQSPRPDRTREPRPVAPDTKPTPEESALGREESSVSFQPTSPDPTTCEPVAEEARKSNDASIPSYEAALEAKARLTAIPAEPKSPSVQPKPVSTSPPIPPPLGRGGREHQRMQRFIAQWAGGMGWRATIEKQTPDGQGSVDVLLEKGSFSVACEISVTTGVEWEMGNIQKCLKAGYSRVFLICTEPKRLGGLRAAVGAAIAPDNVERVHVGLLEELIKIVEDLDAQSARSEKLVKGFKVKVSYKSTSKPHRAEREQGIAETLSKAIRKKQDTDD